MYVFVYSFTLLFQTCGILGGWGGASGKEPPCQFRRHKTRAFDPRVRKIPWRRAWQPTPVFLPGQRILAGYSPWGHKESDLTETTKLACMWNLSSPSRDGPPWKHWVLTTGPPGETFPVKCCFLSASHAGVCQEILFGKKKKKTSLQTTGHTLGSSPQCKAPPGCPATLLSLTCFYPITHNLYPNMQNRLLFFYLSLCLYGLCLPWESPFCLTFHDCHLQEATLTSLSGGRMCVPISVYHRNASLAFLNHCSFCWHVWDPP